MIFVFDVKHKLNIMAGTKQACGWWPLMDVPFKSVYSGVVSLRSLGLAMFLAELNGLTLYSADIGNSYLDAKTKENVYFIVDTGFGDIEGHTLIVCKALYGLWTSGLCWHECFAGILRNMGFTPSCADPDAWMGENNGIYEYLAVYVDDLCIAAPKSSADKLMQEHGYKLKGIGPLAVIQVVISLETLIELCALDPSI